MFIDALFNTYNNIRVGVADFFVFKLNRIC